jgi:fibronectin type 3 domain-containing protein
VAILAAALGGALLSLLPPTAASAATPSAQLSQICGNPGTPGTVHHVIWIWMENEQYSNVIGSPNAPYQTSLAQQCGQPTNFHNESHGSLNNYIAATDGQNILGTSFVNDCLPVVSTGACTSTGSSLFSQLDAAGQTWRGYNEDMPTNCDRAQNGNYLVQHNPAVYYTTLSTCGQFDVPMGDTSTQTGGFYDDVRNGTLPNFSFVTPNLINDAHSSSVATGDSFLSQLIPFITSGANYQAGDTDIIITNDEGIGPEYAINENCTDPTLDLNQPSCHVPTIVVAPYVPAGTTDGTFYTHYSMLRTTEDLLGLPPLGLAASATPMETSFNLGPAQSAASTPPTAPTNLTATSPSSSEVDLSWTAASSGSAAITGYQVSRNGTEVATVSGTTFSDTGLTPGTTYTYSVVAVDANNAIGPASNTAAITTAATNLLTNPGFETWSNGTPAVWSTWGASTTLSRSSDARSGTSSVAIGTTSTSNTATGVTDYQHPTISSTTTGVPYTASCWVKPSATLSISIQLHELKQTGTSVATAVTTTASVPTGGWHQIQVSYTTVGSGDKVPLALFASTKAGGTTFEADDCSLSSTSGPPPDTTPPSVPTNLTATANSSSQVTLSWTASTDNVGVAGYSILRNGVAIAATATPGYVDTGLTPNTTYSYTITASDAAGNVSAQTTAATATTPSATTPPSTPTNLSATTVGPNEIDLSWTASTPGSAPIAGYQITRNGTLLATVSGTGLADTSVSPNTTYTYTVAAVDTANASSGASSPASATTPQVAPGQVTGLSVSAASPTEVDASWNAVPGASAYEVDRSATSASGPFTAVATGLTGTTYADKSVSASTPYWYQVVAGNSAGQGPASSAIGVTTPAVSAALLANTFEGGANGTAITAANSGGGSGNAFNTVSCSAGTLTYNAQSAAHGSESALATPGTNTCYVQWSKSITAVGEAYGRAYVNFSADPTGTVVLLKALSSSSVRDVQVSLSKTGKLSVTDANGTTQVTFTQSIPLNSWVRLEWHLISATNGTFELRMYSADSTTPIESHLLTGINTGTSIGTYQIGALSSVSGGLGTTIGLDNLAYGTSGWLGTT